MRASARAVAWARGSVAGAHPTHQRISGSGASSMVARPSPAHHASRCSGPIPHGLPVRSRPRYAVCRASGNAPCTRTWWRRTSRMSRIGSLPTGQISTHAPQAVHAHSASGESVASSRVCGDAPPAARRDPVASSTYRLLISSADGDRALPVTWAGQTSWQRLHMMQAYASTSCVRGRSSMRSAPHRASGAPSSRSGRERRSSGARAA